jgi:hypothetical protein
MRLKKRKNGKDFEPQRQEIPQLKAQRDRSQILDLPANLDKTGMFHIKKPAPVGAGFSFRPGNGSRP